MTASPQILEHLEATQTDAELFVQDHFERFRSFTMWSAPGGLARIDLAANDARYDKFIEPEIASMLARLSGSFDFTFIKIGDGHCLCLVDAIKIIEMMEAADG
ncbi:MAG: hypothetical protein AAFQ29_10730 [Pseudomonadota bacterium]